MYTKTKIFMVLTITQLTACSVDSGYRPDHEVSYMYQDNGMYTENTYQNYDVYSEKKILSVPDNYHVGSNHAPTPHSNVDKSWAQQQSAQNYTIELTESDKPAEVAKTLLHAPKSERTAEIKSENNGKTMYHGLYGSYPSYHAAEEALKNLPNEIKERAQIKTWSSVQEH